jgi:hypothetical protein
MVRATTLLLGPRPSSDPIKPKIAFHLTHTAVCHVFGEMTQWTTRAGNVAVMQRVRSPLLPRALLAAACKVSPRLPAPLRPPPDAEAELPSAPLSLMLSASSTFATAWLLQPWPPWELHGRRCSSSTPPFSTELTASEHSSHLAAPLGVLAGLARLSQLAAVGAPAVESAVTVAGPPQVTET